MTRSDVADGEVDEQAPLEDDENGDTLLCRSSVSHRVARAESALSCHCSNWGQIPMPKAATGARQPWLRYISLL